ncbi:MAG: hypothetical protein KDN22_18325 [Verrucomicrobiae bacterium]|nr:hypothetical protein [Verrucomicrobiae bacterium]
MALRNVAPKWARIGVIPAVLGMAAIGVLGGLYLGRSMAEEQGYLGIAIAVCYASFFLYVSYRGCDLVRSRSVKAAIVGDVLQFQRRPDLERESILLRDIDIIDYCYKSGMEIVAAIKQHNQGEQD